MEIYSPPYLFTGRDRPPIPGGPTVVQRGTTATFQTPVAGDIAGARLVRPGAVTHTTDLEQRSVALGLTTRSGSVELSIPAETVAP